MTFCAIKTCPNSKMIQFKKRAKMCCFPKRDPKRCLVWIEYVKKEMKISNWTPTKNSALCEVKLIKNYFTIIFLFLNPFVYSGSFFF